MAFHMKTTLNIDDSVMRKLRREAAREGRTMSEMVETALRLLLQSRVRRKTAGQLPSFHSGGMLVDISDRNALSEAMDGR
jgi:plasmid stability protein